MILSEFVKHNLSISISLMFNISICLDGTYNSNGNQPAPGWTLMMRQLLLRTKTKQKQKPKANQSIPTTTPPWPKADPSNISRTGEFLLLLSSMTSRINSVQNATSPQRLNPQVRKVWCREKLGRGIFVDLTFGVQTGTSMITHCKQSQPWRSLWL